MSPMVLPVMMFLSAFGCLCTGLSVGVACERRRIRRDTPDLADLVIPSPRPVPEAETPPDTARTLPRKPATRKAAPAGKRRPVRATSPTVGQAAR